MADNTIQVGITVDASSVTSSMADVNSTFQATTSGIAEQWSQTSASVAVSLKKVGDEAESTAGRTKEQVETSGEKSRHLSVAQVS